MSRYRIEYRKSAVKAFRAMPQSLSARFLAAFEQLANDLDGTGLDIKRLQGREGYRLRIGGWRAIYRIEADRLLIEVINAGVRGDIYK